MEMDYGNSGDYRGGGSRGRTCDTCMCILGMICMSVIEKLGAELCIVSVEQIICMW